LIIFGQEVEGVGLTGGLQFSPLGFNNDEWRAEQYPFRINITSNVAAGIKWNVCNMGENRPLKWGNADTPEQAVTLAEAACDDLLNEMDLHKIRAVMNS
jgi:hypothetical protein